MTVAMLALWWIVGPAPTDQPSVSCNPDRDIILRLPRTFLEQPEMNKPLFSGLTTSFLFTLKAHSSGGISMPGGFHGARLDLRFEPWDEVFHLTLWQYNGSRKTTTLKDLRHLGDWLEKGSLILGSLKGIEKQRWRLEVSLKIVPFSESEQRDAQKWFAKTLGNQPDRKNPNKVLDLLFATSIKRKSLMSRSWKLEATL